MKKGPINKYKLYPLIKSNRTRSKCKTNKKTENNNQIHAMKKNCNTKGRNI